MRSSAKRWILILGACAATALAGCHNGATGAGIGGSGRLPNRSGVRADLRRGAAGGSGGASAQNAVTNSAYGGERYHGAGFAPGSPGTIRYP